MIGRALIRESLKISAAICPAVKEAGDECEVIHVHQLFSAHCTAESNSNSRWTVAESVNQRIHELTLAQVRLASVGHKLCGLIYGSHIWIMRR